MLEDPVFIGISIGVSIAVFIGSLIAIPVALIRLPEDYLVKPPEKPKSLPLAILKNTAGAALLAIGVVLLFLPGQGVLMIIGGLTLVDFPGRHKLMRKLLTKDKVQRAVTAIRRRAGKPPLRTQ